MYQLCLFIVQTISHFVIFVSFYELWLKLDLSKNETAKIYISDLLL